MSAGNDCEERAAFDKFLLFYSTENTWLKADLPASDAIDAIEDAMEAVDARLDCNCGAPGKDYKRTDDYTALKARLCDLLNAHTKGSTAADDSDADDDDSSVSRNTHVSVSEPEIYGPLKECIDNAPVEARAACVDLACRVQNITVSMGTNDIVDYNKIHYSFRAALVPSMKRASKLIHKVGTVYYVNKHLLKQGGDAATEPCHGYVTYSRRGLVDLFENRQVLYIDDKIDPKTKKVHYKVKSVSFIERYLKQQEFFSEKRSVVYMPPEFKPPDESCLNLWEPMAATTMPMPATRDEAYYALLRFLDHLDRMLGNEKSAFEFGVKWFSNLFQFPHVAAKIMLIIVGASGIGKTMLAETISTIMGSHLACKTSNPATDMLGQFNGLIQGKPLVHLEELPAAALKENYERVKDMVGGKTITIQKKHINTSEEPNVMHCLITTNAAAPADPDRRNAQFASTAEFVLNEMHPVGCGCEMCRKSAPFFSSLSALLDKPSTQRVVYEFFKRATCAPKTQTGLDIPQTIARDVARFAHMSTQTQFMMEIVDRYRNDKTTIIAPSTEDELRAKAKLRFTHDELWSEFDAFQRRELSDRSQSRLEKRKALAMFDSFGLHFPTIIMRQRFRTADKKRPHSFIFDIDKLDLHMNGTPGDDVGVVAGDAVTPTVEVGETLTACVAGAPIVVAAYVVASTSAFIEKLDAEGTWATTADDENDAGRRHKREREDDEQQPIDPSSPGNSVDWTKNTRRPR